MDPNDPNNNGNQVPPPDPNGGGGQDITLESLYGPSTPTADTGVAPAPAMPDQPQDQGGLPPQDPMAGQGGPVTQDYAPMDPGQDPLSGTGMPDQIQDFDQPIDSNPTGMPQDGVDQNYYDQAPQEAGMAEDYNQLATDPEATEQMPVEEVQQPEAAYEPAQGGAGLPPIPSSGSKKPLIIIGIVVLVLLVIGGTTAFLLLGTGKKPTPSPTPSALDTPLPCDQDPENPDCQGSALPSETPLASTTPFGSASITASPTAAGSATPSPSIGASPTPASTGVRACELLGTCP